MQTQRGTGKCKLALWRLSLARTARWAFIACGTVAHIGCAGQVEYGPCAHIELGAVPYEYNNGGQEHTTISLSSHWAEIRQEFERTSSATQERSAIAHAVAQCEQAGGEQTPTWQDHPKNHARFAEVGQLDCIAESDNTTTFLLLLRQEGLLRFHEVLRPKFRTLYVFFYPHRTALIRDLERGTVYAVDSWVGSNGDEPLIQEYGAWSRRENPPSSPSQSSR